MLSRTLVPIAPPAPLPQEAPLVTPEIMPFFTPLANTAFEGPEELLYNVHFKGMKVGEATLQVKNGRLVNGRPTLHLTSQARSSSFFDTFFKVRDFNFSLVDRASLASLSFHQNLQEGRYHVTRNVTFNYSEKEWRYSEEYKKKRSVKMGPLKHPIHDILTSIYVARILALPPGTSETLRLFHRGAFLDLPMTVGARVKTVRVPAGSFEVLRVQPEITGDSIFRSEKGALVIWMTNDKRRIPVLIEAQIPVGKVSVRLRSVRRSL